MAKLVQSKTALENEGPSVCNSDPYPSNMQKNWPLDSTILRITCFKSAASAADCMLH